MFLFGTLDRTSSPTVSKLGSRALLYFFHPASSSKEVGSLAPRRRLHTERLRRPLGGPPLSPHQMENIFINALVRAGTCQRHAKHTTAFRESSLFATTHHKARRRQPTHTCATTRGFRDEKGGRHAAQATASAEISQEEFKNLLDYYEPSLSVHDLPPPPPKQAEPESEEPEEPEELGTKETAENIIGIGLIEDSTDESPYKAQPARDDVEREAIDHLCDLLHDEESSHELVYDTYRLLSFPRVSYLTLPTIRRLLHHLAVVEHKNEASMLRYLSIIDDMKAANIPMLRSEWTSAIAFAGRCFRKVTSAEVESALYIWREMENEAGIRGREVTFNVLFDVATKAGKFVLAEMILKEMRARNLHFSRYTRTGLIYYHGLRGDGNGVRNAYKELVESGEIVDAVVLNCVMASLIRAGEPSAAEQVFLRMKKMHASKTGVKPAPRHWREKRELAKTLTRLTQEMRKDPEASRKLQDDWPIAPDAQTFRILIKHHALTSGNIDRITELLDEMSLMNIPVDPMAFTLLLSGFQIHGGIRYSSWTRVRLERLWIFLKVTLEEDEEFRLERSMTSRVLRAYAKCSSRERTMEIWEEIKSMWASRLEDVDHVDFDLSRLFPPELAELG
ncbi:hypothetical protein W97_01970 [Coniosporium apollinis CBS 100218]|uniref:Pentacotripeptide-repeat region of PRORP domain-containing protein n=1 Tax=Coniosporium apollinis (strain CBS 100218) TaxID=1168221 RepID=R7YLG3_CONA1|nr:uncharacterized protein W97_01970 [Coniosporium apollinis CBS 100218]EON62745.1 hypothetical protein W97_01970 [Coniosporium apollinis CBS 100218]